MLAALLAPVLLGTTPTPVASFPFSFYQYNDLIHGVIYTNPASLPTGATISSDPNGTTYSVNASAGALRSQAVTSAMFLSGFYTVLCPLVPQSTFNASDNYKFTGGTGYGASAIGYLYYQPANGRATAGAHSQTQDSVVDSTHPVADPDALSIPGKPLIYSFSGQNLVTPGNPVIIQLSSERLATAAAAKCPGGGGRTVAIQTGSSAGFYVTNLTSTVTSSIFVAAEINYGEKILGCTVYGPNGQVTDSMLAPTDHWAGQTLQLGASYGHVSLFLSDAGYGTYNLYFEGPKALRKKVVFQWNGQPNPSIGAINMAYGDLDQDGIITQAEYDAVVAAMGKSYLDSDWYLSSAQYPPYFCDLDGNGVVNANDLTLIQGNVGKVSD